MLKEGKLFNIDLAIKFGSKEIIIYRKGFGIVAKQPALIAYEDGKFKAFGKAAQNLKLQQVKGVEVYEPIVNSAVEDERKAILLLDKLLKDVINDRILITKISALVAVPCALNQRQLLLLKKVLNSAGIGKVTFVQNSVCAYAHMDMDPFSHIMVVDIGKYLTDISVLNEFTFDFGRMFFIGGADMDKSITTFIEDNYNVKVSDAVSEEIKNEIASLYQRDLSKYEFVGSADNNKIVRETITANEVRVAICNFYDTILKMVTDILDSLHPNLRAEIYHNGIVFIGGASCISGLYEYATKKLEVPVIIPEEPMDCVILGAGKLLSSEKDFLKINL